jgi:hypothetical protein
MPSFTFAAAAHAALWCGLTPLLCDIDPATWAADSLAESEMLSRYAGKIAVVMPYATFGYPIDLERYTRIAAQLGVPVVVDGAASLGTFDEHGRGFGTGFAGTVVYSMHATKSFAVGEAGLIYSAVPERIATLRTMSSFGFGDRIARPPKARRLRQHFGPSGCAARSLSRGTAGIAVPMESARHPGASVCACLIAIPTENREGGDSCAASRSGNRDWGLLQPTLDGAALLPKNLRRRSDTGLRRCFRKDDQSTSVRHHDSR